MKQAYVEWNMKQAYVEWNMQLTTHKEQIELQYSLSMFSAYVYTTGGLHICLVETVEPSQSSTTDDTGDIRPLSYT